MKRIHQVLVFALLFAPALSTRADDSYQVSKTDAVVTLGGKGKASVTIAAKKGWHLNAEAPLTLRLGTTPGLVTEKAKLGRPDLAMSNETQARFDVVVAASEPGKKALEAEAGFVLCQEDSCRPVKEKLVLTVDATEPVKADTPKKTAKKK